MKRSFNSANTQSELYHQLRKRSLPVEVEFKCPYGRFDLIVKSEDDERIVAIVEVKRGSRKDYTDSKQINRYLLAGVPVYVVQSINKVETLAYHLSTLRGGVAITKIMSKMATPSSVAAIIW